MPLSQLYAHYAARDQWTFTIPTGRDTGTPAPCMVQHHLDPKIIAEQPEETWLRPADWETYHSKVQEIVVDVEPANINDLLMDSG